MKVKELIQALQEFDQDDEVHFSYQYGDYGRTVVADAINTIEAQRIKYSDYHNTYRLVDEDEDLEDTQRVVVLG